MEKTGNLRKMRHNKRNYIKFGIIKYILKILIHSLWKLIWNVRKQFQNSIHIALNT